MILLDTHVLVWFEKDDPRLGALTRTLIEAQWAEANAAVSAVSFWECALLQTKGRLAIDNALEAWRADLLASGLAELPLDGASAILSAALDLPQKDPADRFIVAAAHLFDATLLTADERLLSWQGPLKRRDARA